MTTTHNDRCADCGALLPADDWSSVRCEACTRDESIVYLATMGVPKARELAFDPANYRTPPTLPGVDRKEETR